MTTELRDNFYGVYLLVNNNENPKHKGKCYVGFTVNPTRRINQHNRGKKFGGAGHTSRIPGPWTMVLIVHDFPENISALRFEWAWQEPKVSRRLKNIESLQRKKPKESHFDYHFRILTEMLGIGPWNRLPLKIRWIEQEYYTAFPPDKLPAHMEILFGHIKSLHKTVSQTATHKELIDMIRNRRECHLCLEEIANLNEERVFCVNSSCKLVSHLRCLAKKCLEPGHYVPIKGICVLCDCQFLWNDVIRRKNGYRVSVDYSRQNQQATGEDDDELDL